MCGRERRTISTDCATPFAAGTIHAVLAVLAVHLHDLAAALALVALGVVFLAFGFLDDVGIARSHQAGATAAGLLVTTL